ncbi:lipopolysaccharide kinase InaA family protein [Psychroserpens algicola]|uniref:Lipopolysaccharide kinase InaA family protein n=1 Tax=Psychroserpens algicola TaxID=1719034 RepID=A0ABT0HCR8_9FLAO|nr:lipopolysaccharide kinase InaA family protein [Psychroserpens algicola]MCK8481977.1 lipopolysaccharide kinase InaA family protein [Psychroserpens algicola]
MNYEISEDYKTFQKELDAIVINFASKGRPFGNQDRNTLKLFELNGETVNVKSFRVPNIVNQIAYRFFRKSKAQRSFEYAHRIINLGIGTPKPIAYYEFKTPFAFKKSYYISEQLDCDCTYRELKNPEYPDREAILRAFTRFTYKLHECQVYFLDHSPGNTLIKKTGDTYAFFLVDLNRMEFKALDFKTRIKNFAKLATEDDMIKIMSDEYAKCISRDFKEVYALMSGYTKEFQERYQRRRRLKKKIKFWKK